MWPSLDLLAKLPTPNASPPFQVLYGALTQAMGEGVAEVSRRLDDTRAAIQQSIDQNHQALLKKLDSLGNWRQGLDAMSPPLRAFWESHTDGSRQAARIMKLRSYLAPAMHDVCHTSSRSSIYRLPP